jgi:eukaryotic-like serine/threonine-protein kinase
MREPDAASPLGTPRGVPHAANADASFPERIGRYELLLPIGRGGMATVYLARMRVVESVHREVALKLMHNALEAEEGEFAQQLLEEAKLAARIQHPNVVPVLEFGASPFGVYLVMEYVRGHTLSGLIRAAKAANATLPLPIAGKILSDALTGLHAAHELRDENGVPLEVIHRDFSPQNILVGVDGVSRLTDFGIAKTLARLDATKTGVIKGKIGYMAPEQALGHTLDRRCDVWAAGVVACELLTGQRLYSGKDQLATLLELATSKPPRLRTLRPDLPLEVDEIIAEALTTHPEARCNSASEFRRRLLLAWQKIGPIADSPEVGAYVAELVQDKLRTRDEQAASVLRLRDEMATISRDASALASTKDLTTTGQHLSGELQAARENGRLSGLEPALPAGRATMGSRANIGHEIARPRPKLHPMALGLALLTLTIAAAAIALWSGNFARTNPGAETQAPPASVTSSALPAVTPSALPAVTPSALPASLTIVSDLPLIGVRLNDRVIAPASPASELEIGLSPAESSGPLLLEVRALGGQRKVVRLERAEPRVFVAFGGAEIRGQTRAKPARAKSKPDPPGLAPTPYQRKE